MGHSGWIRLDDFCRASGLSPQHVDSLVRDGRLELHHDDDGRVLGFYDDSPPSEDELRLMGLPVRPDYDPEQLTSYADPRFFEDDGDDQGETSWTMAWGEL